MIDLSSTHISKLYSKYILVNENDEYLSRYTPLPLHLNNKEWKWEGKDFPRVIMLLEFERLVDKYNLKSDKFLSFNCYNDPEVKCLPIKEMFNFNWKDDNINYDLHTLNIPKNDYDFVMLNQTFEHLYNPYKCLENIHKNLKSGGYIYCNVPTVNIQHSLPYNYYTGYTPIGLACLFESCEFEILEVGQWGNKQYISKIFNDHTWPDYRQVDTTNEFSNPAQCWILARKK